MASKSTKTVAARIPITDFDSLSKLAQLQGLSISEYLCIVICKDIIARKASIEFFDEATQGQRDASMRFVHAVSQAEKDKDETDNESTDFYKANFEIDGTPKKINIPKILATLKEAFGENKKR